MIRTLAALLLCAAAGPGWTLALDLPQPARQTARETEGAARTLLPTGPWDGASVPTRVVEGAVARTAWRLGGQVRTTPQIAAPLRRKLQDSGYRIAFECAAEDCGGYDFRFAIDTLDAPDMYVDLGDFHYILAERPDGSEPLSLLISQDGDAGFVQLTQVTDAPVPAPPDAGPAPERDTGADLWQRLRRDGRARLDDLQFATGSAALAEGAFGSLEALADGLGRDPSIRLALVGHTDAEGALGANVVLSRRRAEAVRRRLIDRHGVAPERLAAEGVGFLAPRASNATEDGRLANRRVEVIVTQ